MAETLKVDLRAFTIDANKFATQMRIGVNQASRSLAFELFGRVIQRTPVLTGFLKAGWNLSIDTPDFRTPREGLDRYPPPVMNPTLPTIGNRFRDYFIANGVPYSVPVDEGYPNGQSPEGIVIPALMDIDFTLEQLFREAK